MINRRYYKIFIALVVVLVGGAIFWYARGHGRASPAHPPVSTGTSHTIILTKDGFTPSEITIHQGDTVIFSTQLNEPFWPASDPHPTHDIYPEFDPRQPIVQDKSWSFTFARVGSWKYHNHLFFTQRGIINVVAPGTSSVLGLNCQPNSQEPQCWDEQINSALKGKSLDEAFNVMAHLYETQPQFAYNCHGYAHELGQKAYELYSQGKEVALSAKATYCGYGFYHGFMETLLHTTGNIQEAKDFCAYAGREMMSQTTDAEGACYHGIGHGAVDGGDPATWGDAQKMIEPSLKLCQSVAGDDTSRFGKLYRCVSGAFNALQILSTDPKYKLDKLVADPFSICPSQPYNFLEACYTNMLPGLMNLDKDDFLTIAKAIEKIPEPKDDYTIRAQVMLSLTHEWIRENLSALDYNAAAGVAICRKLQERSRLPCVEGLSGGHMKYGKPGVEYVQALAFCGSSMLRPDEKQVCYDYILTRLRIWYTAEKSLQICTSVPKQFQSLCNIQN